MSRRKMYLHYSQKETSNKYKEYMIPSHIIVSSSKIYYVISNIYFFS